MNIDKLQKILNIIASFCFTISFAVSLDMIYFFAAVIHVVIILYQLYRERGIK